MWYPPVKKSSSIASTPRSGRKNLGTPRTPKKHEGDLSARSDADDDNKSKITVVSLKSNRTSRTVQTMQSIPEPSTSTPRFSKKNGMFGKVKEGFREASIKRIVASGLCIATTLMILFGVFLPFWNVYKYDVSGVTTGYYGGLWNYCEVVTGGDTTCKTYNEADNAHWFRAVRFLEMMAFFGIVASMALVTAYMFCLRHLKYLYIQWIIIGLCFGTGLFTLIGLIVYGASYSNSSHLSSAYGLTFCGFFGCVITGALFLWDKIEMIKNKDDAFFKLRGISAVPGSRARARSRLSHVRSHRSHARSQRTQFSLDTSQRSHPLGQPNGLARQTTQASARGVILTPIEGKR